MTEKFGNYLTKEMCDQSSIIAGENKMLAEIPVILDRHHGQTGNVNCYYLPLGKDLPNKDQVEQLFKIGCRYGNVLIEWLGMKTLLVSKEHWNKPLLPKWKSLPKKKKDGVSNMDIWDYEEEEEDDWDETDPEVKATAGKEDDDSQFFKELEAIAKVAE